MAPFIVSSVKGLASGYQGEKSKCRLMKVSKKVADPIITKILFGITEDKMDGETLKEYALRKGMTLKLFESIFSEDHEKKAILENPDYFHNFDQSLKFKCIREFKKFNSKLIYNIRMQERIQGQLDKLKHIRNNNLCHNREYLTGSQCYELALSMKDPLVDLTEIIQITWDGSINVPYEVNKIESSTYHIMNGSISYCDFRYMCLQIVIKFVAEQTLYTITKLICCDKEEDNYEDYLLKKGMNKRKYKDIFFSDEQTQLKRKSSEMMPDLTMCSKIIVICKDWHYKLNTETKEELGFIIGNMRSIRNRINHKMLSMTPDECIMEAENLGESLKELGRFAQKTNLYEGLDVPELDIDKIAFDINGIMSLPQF